jgi:predicted membrane protein
MNRRTKNIISAILLIALAVCLILWKLNVFNLPLSFAGVGTWGIIISIFMLVIIFHSVIDLNFGGIFIPLAVLAIIFDDPLGITAITPWIVIIVAILLTIAFEKLFPRHAMYFHRRYRKNKDGESYSNDFTHSEGNVDDENGIVNYSLRFGSATKYVRSKNLNSVDLSSQFGEMSVFFDGAEVPGGKVNIDCQVSFGEMQLFIPKEWNVINKVTATLGDCDDRGIYTNTSADAVQCVIDGSVSFGELKITKI